jgi:dihydroorotate dehydrogenase
MYRKIIKPLLFKLDPEKAHNLTFKLLSIVSGIPFLLPLLRFLNRNRPSEGVIIAGLRFPNRVGLAAGLDKDAHHFLELGALGFGFVEVGTVTPEPQPGNPQPRLFRLPQDNALINRMGFNNRGVDNMFRRLQQKRHGLVIGGNIGKNKTTPNERAADDYSRCFRTLFPAVDYFVVNVSSPNTPGLRELQEKGPLKALLNGLQQLNKELAAKSMSSEKPVFLKIAPDLTVAQLDDVIEVVLETKCAGVIATNTTVSRSGLKTEAEKITSIGAGGLSGKPLTDRSTEVIRYLAERSKGNFSIIGVGGIHSPKDALEKIEAGASLIQLYTGFVYEGPRLIRTIRKAIAENQPLTSNH